MATKRWRLAAAAVMSMAVSGCGVVDSALSDGSAEVDTRTWELTGAVSTNDVGIREYEPSPDGRWVAFRESEEMCLAPASAGTDGRISGSSDGAVCFETFARQASWSPDSTRVVVNIDGDRTLERGPVEVFGVDGSRTTLVEGDDQAPLVFDAYWIDADTIIYADFDLAADPRQTTWFTVDVASGDRSTFFEPPDDFTAPSVPWAVASGRLGTTLFGADGSVELVVWDGSSSTTPAEAPAVDDLDLRSMGGNELLLRNANGLFSEPGATSGWWVVPVGDAQSTEPQPTEPQPTELDVGGIDEGRILDAVLSPNGTTIAVLVMRFDAERTSDFSLVVMSVDELRANAGAIDPTAGVDVVLSNGIGPSLSEPQGPLRWAQDDRVVVIGDGELLWFEASPELAAGE